ncbi:WD repeat domain-containing protein 83 isoform X3 [Tetranychus urticae]|uniref:WD repeat domain-containing protein 83 isoform X3 n=1 Tax=Tetranychus urticae TaxID=32264 RepID=UPI00077BE2A1|nr:WD repeat domain-containing protein 83 isoform X3 [Tetranychus urticae]
MTFNATLIKSISCSQGAIRAVRFNVDGDYCITCGSDKSIKLWNPRKSLLLKTYSGHGYEVMDARGSCDSSHIASGGMDKCIFLWDVSTGQVVKRYRAHHAFINCVQFNEESTVILSGSVDCTVKTWDCKSKSRDPIQIFNEAKDSITSIAVSNYEIITGSLDGKVRRYDLRKGQLNVDDQSSPVNYVSLTKDGQCLLISCGNGVIKLLEKETGEILSEYRGHVNNKYRLESGLINNDSIVVSGSEDANLVCWDLIQKKVIQRVYHANHRVVHSLSCHPSKNEILTSAEGSIHLWEFIEPETS